jgi:hypothetical protein
MGDPLLWPEIYRINTTVVEDPHWIFPGEELRLTPPDTIFAQAPDEQAPVAEEPMRPVDTPAPPPPPTSAQAPTVFARNRGSVGRPDLGRRTRPSRVVSRTDFYSAGFLTEGEDFPWGTVLGATGQSTLGTLTASSSAVIFETVRLRAPQDASYQVGDSLLVARLGRDVRDWGTVVVPSGVVRVTAVSGEEAEAVVLMQFGVVADGQVSIPLETYVARTATARPVTIENGMRGEIVTIRDQHPVPNQQDIVFIDRGREDGVELGDVFEVLVSREVAGIPERQVATIRIVHIRNRSASGFILGITDLGVEASAPVRLIRKMAT